MKRHLLSLDGTFIDVELYYTSTEVLHTQGFENLHRCFEAWRFADIKGGSANQKIEDLGDFIDMGMLQTLEEVAAHLCRGVHKLHRVLQNLHKGVQNLQEGLQTS